MKARPILFSTPMVRSLLAGAKTQTRRIIKPQPQKLNAAEFQWKNGLCAMNWLEKQSPFGLRGEHVWVREAWRAPKSLDDLSGKQIGEKAIDAGYRKPWSPIQFEADQSQVNDWAGFGVHPNTAVPGRYRHARFMPRWASRLTLRITEVRVERLQDISEADARAEGIEFTLTRDPFASGRDACRWASAIHPQRAWNSARAAYEELWESLNGPGSWARNDWTWALTFTVIKANVDDVMREAA